jgi:predicted amino acid-binding ACT domain protein
MDRIVIVVLGADQAGIIARFSGRLYSHNINIEDVQQKIMDGIFVMTMLVDISRSSASAETIRQELEELGQEIGLKVMVQNEAVLKAMHRV